MKTEFAPDLILYNGKIVTVDSRFSIVEAVAVYDGKFAATGSSASIRELAGKHTRTVDLRGRCLVPGQMDNHVHFLLAGLDGLQSGAKVNIATLQSIEEILDAIHKRAQSTPQGRMDRHLLYVPGSITRGTLSDPRRPG